MKSSRIYQQRSIHCCLASSCDSTLTSKGLLKMRKHQILLADLITASSAVGSDDKMVEISLAQTKSPESSCCYKDTNHTLVPNIVFGIPGSQTKLTTKQKTSHSLRWPTDHQGHSGTSQTRRLWARCELLAQGQGILCTLTVPWDSEGCFLQPCKNPQNMAMRHQVTLDCHYKPPEVNAERFPPVNSKSFHYNSSKSK